jgi:predicted SPOUT superfamily RNA methylase MTH1
MIYVAAGLFTQGGGGTVASSRVATDQLGGYVRLAAILDIAGFDTVIGGWYAAPKTAIAGGGLTPPLTQPGIRNGTDGKSFGLDVQMQGELGDLLVGFNMPVIIKGEQATPVGGLILDDTGIYPLVAVGFGHAGVYAGYDYRKVETLNAAVAAVTTKTWVVGAWYSIAQNVESKLEYNSASMSNAVTNSNNWTLLLEYVY